jgi:hypothetical protein
MTFSKYGALSQAFVMQAIEHLADLVIEQEQDLLEDDEKKRSEGKISFISVPAWIGVAKEIKEQFVENRDKF